MSSPSEPVSTPKMNSISVSIIIPVYNVESYVKDCIQSVMRQTYEGPIECILVDDCGGDDSLKITEREISNYEGPITFRFLHHSINRGLSAARNTGINAATGEYLFFLDCDDMLTEGCIKALVNVAATDPAIEIVQGNTRTNQEGIQNNLTKRYTLSHVTCNREVRNSYFQQRQFIHNAWNKLIKSSFLLNNHLMFREGIVFEDFLWTFYVLKLLRNVYFVPEITYLYRSREGSIMTGTRKEIMARCDRIIYQEILNNPTINYEVEVALYK